MRGMRLFYLFIIFTLIVLCSSGIQSQQNNSVFSLNTGNQTYEFIPQPQLGFVIKSSSSKSAMTLLENSLQGVQINDKEKHLDIANRPDMIVVLGGERPLVQSQNIIRTLNNQADTEYVAPVYSLNGQTVAIIPEIIVRLINESDYIELEDLCRQLDCKIVTNILYTKKEFLILPQAHTAQEVLTIAEVLSSEAFIEWAFPNLAFQPQLFNEPVIGESNRLDPNDTYFDKQWHLEKIHAPEAWKYTTGDPNIVIAVLDQGVEINHPDLAGNIWTNPNEIPDNGIDDDENGQKDDIHGWDFFGNSNNVNPESDDAHGTACAGLIAAKGNNNLGVTGVAWNCTIMPIRISGQDKFITEENIANAFRYAAISGADILSNSWGSAGETPIIYSAIKDITKVDGIGRKGKGCIVIFSSGNWLDGGPVSYPAKYPEVLAIGAINQDDIIWGYSGSGPEIDFVTPSGDTSLKGNIWTTDITGRSGYNNRDSNILDYTDKMGGTSGACPIAAGVVALVLSADPNLTNNEVEGILLNSARDLGPLGWDRNYGYGCLDACIAVSSVCNPRLLEIFVDDDAPNDPGPGDTTVSDPLEDGSQEHPFDSIKEAVNYAVYKDTVTILPGIYTGQGNYNIDLFGKAIVVHSRDGAESCTIDCQNNGQAFSLQRKEGLHSVIDGLTIINGQASKGGGINIIYSSPTIINCIFSGNTANWGGGIGCTNSSPVIRNCIFSGNSADSDGAGIYNNNSIMTISDCNFTGNIAVSRGGGIYNYKSSMILENLKFSENSAQNGAGIYNDYGNLTINNCIFTKNSAQFGGGISNSNSNPSITNCIFTENKADRDGGGIYNQLGNSILNYCIFTRNTAYINGAGIYIRNSLSELNNCTFNANSTNGNGGGIYSNNGCQIIDNCRFVENSANDKGGGIYNQGSSTIFNSCSFTENSANNMGGGMFNSTDAKLFNCAFERNTSDSGGAMYCYSGHPEINTSIFTENSARWYGGAMYFNGSSSHAFFCIFNKNISAFGSAVYGYTGSNNISCCTFYRNDDGIYQESGTCYLEGSIFWLNNIDIYGRVFGGYDHIQTEWTDPKNVVHLPNYNDPLFVDPENGDFHLKSQAGRWDPLNKVWVQDDVTSPCIDVGDPAWDVADEVWPHGNIRNIGAYSGTSQASLSLSDTGEIRDLNNNNSIAWDDVLLLVEKWHSPDAPLREDLDRNGIVDVDDLAYFYGNWSNSSNNIVPVFDFTGVQYITAGNEQSFSVSASDGDNNSLIYLALGLPEGAEFSEQVFSWTPQQAGVYSITFIVSDYKSLDYMTVNIFVEEE